MEIILIEDNSFTLQKKVKEFNEQGYRVKFPPVISGAANGDSYRAKGEVQWVYCVVMEKVETQH